MVTINSRFIYLLAIVFGMGFSGVASSSISGSAKYAADMLNLSIEYLPLKILPAELSSAIDQANGLMRGRRFVEAGQRWQAVYQQANHAADFMEHNDVAALALLAHCYVELLAGNVKLAENSLDLAFKKLYRLQQAPALMLASAYFLAAEIDELRYKLDSAVQNFQLAQRWINAGSLDIADSWRDEFFAKLSLAGGEAWYRLEKYDDAKQEFEKAMRWALSARDADMQLAARTAKLALMLRTSQQLEKSSLIQLVSRPVGNNNGAKRLNPDSVLLFADVISQIPSHYWPAISEAILRSNAELDDVIDATAVSPLLKSAAMTVKSQFYAISGRQQEAQTLLLNAIRIEQQYGDKLQLSRSLAQYADLKKRQGDYVAALKAYRMAVKHLDAFKEDIVAAGENTLFHSDDYYNDVYLGLADVLLIQSDKQSSLRGQQSLLREARQVLETKKNVDLQNYFHDQCIANFKHNMRTLDELAQPDTAVFYPIVLPDRLELLLSHNGRLKRFVSDVGREQLRHVLLNFRHQLLDVNTESYLPTAKRLYDWIIRPMQASLDKDKIKNLVIVSEELLRTVPFSVFNDGKRFLVQKYALALSPALSLTDSTKINRSKMQVLLGGLSESVQGFPALTYVKGELEEIQDLYANELLLNRDFVTSRFSEALSDPQFSVAHVASHSEMSFDSRRSYILTFDGKISLDQLGTLTSLQKRHRPIELLTLSACQTAAGDDRAALGLAGVAVKSGARSALATLWAIDDLASSLLVSEFYRQLSHSDISKAEALRNAQNALIASRRFGHPAYWSSFLLIGNWM